MTLFPMEIVKTKSCVEKLKCRGKVEAAAAAAAADTPAAEAVSGISFLSHGRYIS